MFINKTGRRASPSGPLRHWVKSRRGLNLAPAAAHSILRYIVFRYTIIVVAIQSFKCSDTEALHRRRRVARFVNIESVARRKLAQLDAAATLEFMRVPPGNRLEALKGNRAGQHSIRINDQWRLCFIWTAQGPGAVEIVDNH